MKSHERWDGKLCKTNHLIQYNNFLDNCMNGIPWMCEESFLERSYLVSYGGEIDPIALMEQ